jgi:hypothetical protein
MAAAGIGKSKARVRQELGIGWHRASIAIHPREVYNSIHDPIWKES